MKNLLFNLLHIVFSISPNILFGISAGLNVKIVLSVFFLSVLCGCIHLVKHFSPTDISNFRHLGFLNFSQ